MRTTMSDYDPAEIAWDAKMKEAFDRIEARKCRSTNIFNRPDKRLVGGGPSMSDEHIKGTMEQLTASHIEFDRREGRRRIKLLLDEREKSLPADVPLPKRGFGVMDEDGP
jgi:hypothetical protein